VLAATGGAACRAGVGFEAATGVEDGATFAAAGCWAGFFAMFKVWRMCDRYEKAAGYVLVSLAMFA